MNHTYGIGSAIFEKQIIKHKLGEGSLCTVYEIQREDFGEVYRAALKVITVPQSDVEFQGALDEGMSRVQAEEYFYSVVEDTVREFAIMAKLKDTDHQYNTSKTYSMDGVLLAENDGYNNTLYLYDSEGKLVRTLNFARAAS